MKTKAQILRYISQCYFSDDDWQKVLAYCRQMFGGGKAHRALRPLPNSQSTYQNFLEWVDNGIGVGDIVRYGHTLGIIGAYTPGCAKLAAYLSFEGDLIDNTIEISKDKIYRANDAEIALVKQKLVTNGLEFLVSMSCCIKTYQPKDGEIVRITKDKYQTTAIFQLNDGQFNCFYVYVDDGEIARNKRCKIGSISMSAPTKTDIQRLLVSLAKNGLEWLPRHKALRSIEMSRAASGGKYWYLSERFSICSDIDKYTKLHDERHKCGNYFVSYQAAILFAQKVKELRKEINGVE